MAVDGRPRDGPRQGARGPRRGDDFAREAARPLATQWDDIDDSRGLHAYASGWARGPLSTPAAISGTPATAASLPVHTTCASTKSRTAGPLDAGTEARGSPAAAGRRRHRLSRGILRSCAAGSQRVMTHQAHSTRHRPSRTPCPSFGDDSARRCADAGACRDRDHRGRDLRPLGLAGGSRVGPFVGLNRAVLGRVRRVVGPSGFACLPSFAGIFAREVAPNAMLHTREVAGSKPAAPIARIRLYRAVRSLWAVTPSGSGA
jgi:hypothetical protein